MEIDIFIYMRIAIKISFWTMPFNGKTIRWRFMQFLKYVIAQQSQRTAIKITLRRWKSNVAHYRTDLTFKWKHANAYKKNN